jgi:hypothetical protein
MSDLIKFVKGFVPYEDVRLISKYAKENDSNFTDFGNTEQEFTFHADFKNNDIKTLLQGYQKHVYRFVQENYPGPFEEYNEDKIHIARFAKGHGMHEHFDTTKPNDITTLIYLNEDYEGGQIYFPELNIYIKPQEGDLLCFPDTPDFVHGVKPITEGVRYTAPRWFTRIV